MAVTLTYDAALYRNRISAASLGGTVTYAVVDRSIDGTTWTTVRGGTAVPVSGGATTTTLSDYEWTDAVANTYRVRGYNVSNVLVATQTASITSTLTAVVLVSITRPFLNRAVTLGAIPDISRGTRAGVFDIIGRTMPVGITDIGSARRLTLELVALTAAESLGLDYLVTSGDPLFVHSPATFPLPSLYAVINGDVTSRKPYPGDDVRFVSIPLAEVAAPAADIVGTTGTWSSVVAAYATWTVEIAAQSTWQTLLELVGAPTEVVVA